MYKQITYIHLFNYLQVFNISGLLEKLEGKNNSVCKGGFKIPTRFLLHCIPPLLTDRSPFTIQWYPARFFTEELVTHL